MLLPKVGNQDEIHGYLVDLMVAMKTMVGTGATFDVSNWLWHEMYNMVIYRKVPIYAPFVMCFLNSVWAIRRPGELLTSPDNLTVHEVKLLKNKKHASLASLEMLLRMSMLLLTMRTLSWSQGPSLRGWPNLLPR